LTESYVYLFLCSLFFLQNSATLYGTQGKVIWWVTGVAISIFLSVGVWHLQQLLD